MFFRVDSPYAVGWVGAIAKPSKFKTLVSFSGYLMTISVLGFPASTQPTVICSPKRRRLERSKVGVPGADDWFATFLFFGEFEVEGEEFFEDVVVGAEAVGS